MVENKIHEADLWISRFDSYGTRGDVASTARAAARLAEALPARRRGIRVERGVDELSLESHVRLFDAVWPFRVPRRGRESRSIVFGQSRRGKPLAAFWRKLRTQGTTLLGTAGERAGNAHERREGDRSGPGTGGGQREE